MKTKKTTLQIFHELQIKVNPAKQRGGTERPTINKAISVVKSQKKTNE